MLCHAVSALCTPSFLHPRSHTKHTHLPPHPINPPHIIPPLPLVRLTQARLPRWLLPGCRLTDGLAGGHVTSCCSPSLVALVVGCGFVLLLLCGGFAAQRVCGLFDGSHVEERGQAWCCGWVALIWWEVVW